MPKLFGMLMHKGSTFRLASVESEAAHMLTVDRIVGQIQHTAELSAGFGTHVRMKTGKVILFVGFLFVLIIHFIIRILVLMGREKIFADVQHLADLVQALAQLI